MATIKAIEARSVHQIQSGQVIVDLCSVAKELVENSLDAGASAIEVRFKNNGLDAIEVQDNGSGISPANYESIALKHYTSKLSSYEDLSSLLTFGFRGEAISSLCALSNFHITTAQADEAPKGNRLEFEVSGKLKSTSVVACQKGTIASVEGLFQQLPVRQKELAKNIKREYGKVLGLLHAYACISTNVKFTVKNAMPKGKNAVVFSTNSNPTTKENIANVYGAKTLSALVALDLELEFQSSAVHRKMDPDSLYKISVRGHISRPGYGEGRQTPDRQMFFVNARPCGLPQIAKAINEVYKSFNVSQSPFIFADLKMDTNAYDVNVSPDKRTILLHDSALLVENLKISLVELFENQEQSVPQSQLQGNKLPAFRPLNVRREISTESAESTRPATRQVDTSPGLERSDDSNQDEEQSEEGAGSSRLLHDFFRNQASTREEGQSEKTKSRRDIPGKAKEKMTKSLAERLKAAEGRDEYDDVSGVRSVPQTYDDRDNEEEEEEEGEKYDDDDNVAEKVHVRDFNSRMAEQQQRMTEQPDITHTPDIPEVFYIPPAKQTVQPNAVQDAFDRMRPKRVQAEVATFTVGNKTITTIVGSQRPNKIQIDENDSASKRTRRLKTTPKHSLSTNQFSQNLRHFTAPGPRIHGASSTNEDAASDIEVADNRSDIEEDRDRSVPASDAESGVYSPEQESESESQALETDGNQSEGSESDGEYADEAEKKAKEEARVESLIRVAEESAALPSKDSIKRADKVLRSANSKDSTTNLLARVDFSVATAESHIRALQDMLQTELDVAIPLEEDSGAVESEDQRLSLIVSKDDFANMHIVGQFNLGFILAVRPPSVITGCSTTISRSDELFIIDQHASDEKFNFERLQADTVVGNQRLVRPMVLELTAVEEEIVIENAHALEMNGFSIDVDTSGDHPIGERCKLVSLPLSKEVVFDTRDLDELIHLLAEAPLVNDESIVPRPSKVRKMFAMRACRSSIMIGKTLTGKQMSSVVRHMGTIDKPWNCPHGRPTMRHLMSLTVFDVWDERDRIDGLNVTDAAVWKEYGQ